MFRRFESQHCILDGHFFTDICCKNCNDVCLKRLKINKKRPGLAYFFYKKTTSASHSSSTTINVAKCNQSKIIQLKGQPQILKMSHGHNAEMTFPTSI